MDETVSFFANSELPNSWFLQQFNDPPNNGYPFYKKQYWDLFAKVLVKRITFAFIQGDDLWLYSILTQFLLPGTTELPIYINLEMFV